MGFELAAGVYSVRKRPQSYGQSLPCPACGAATGVLDTRGRLGRVHRRRVCENGHRFSTHEVIVAGSLTADSREETWILEMAG